MQPKTQARKVIEQKFQSLCMWGYIEYDGSRFCHEHACVQEAGDRFNGVNACPAARRKPLQPSGPVNR